MPSDNRSDSAREKPLRVESRRPALVTPSYSFMGWLFGGAEYTPLFVVTFLTLVYLGLWASLAVWGPDTPRVGSLLIALEKAFTFFLGLFSGIGISIGTRRR